MKQMIAPDGAKIVGTKEHVPGCAHVKGFSNKGEPDYAGSSDMWWDDSTTQYHENQEGNESMIVVDENGEEHVASDCTLVDE